MTTIRGLHHIKLTVSDLTRSKAFYVQLPGFKLVAEYPDFIMFSAGNINIGLTTHTGKRVTNHFNEFAIGLDHLAFKLINETALNEVLEFLDNHRIPHSGIKTLSNGTKIVIFRDPDNLQLEFAY